jgi:hypothetical protein
MKSFLIAILVLVTIQVKAQGSDSLKVSNSTPLFSENTAAFYDKLSAKIVVSPLRENENYKIELFDITGISIRSEELYTTVKNIEIPIWLKSGIYILIIRNKQSNLTRKFRVN